MINKNILTFFIFFTETVLFINFGLIIILGLGRLWLTAQTSKIKRSKSDINYQKKPFVSIHIPICSEPWELVEKTLISAYNQNYNNFEIIVLSNNTSNEELWKPIEAFCKNKDSRIIFLHVNYLSGFKAGALNLCRKITNKKAKYIFTVDADYVLIPNAIEFAINQIKQHRTALIQFPQEYYNKTHLTTGLSENFKHYFNIYSRSCNPYFTSLPTGTLSLINLKSLDSIGGWPTNSITEDSQLGLELITNGYKMLYIPITIGKGVMPTNIDSLISQRSRWIFGNFQTLKKLKNNLNIPLKIRWVIALQLTSWINFLGLPFITLFIFCLIVVYNSNISIGYTINLSILSIIFHYILQFILFGISTKMKFKKQLNCFLIHIALLEKGAFVWWQNILGISKPFIRTNKFYLVPKTKIILILALPLLIFILASTILLFYSKTWGILLFLIFLSILIGKFIIIKELNNARQF